MIEINHLMKFDRAVTAPLGDGARPTGFVEFRSHMVRD